MCSKKITLLFTFLLFFCSQRAFTNDSCSFEPISEKNITADGLGKSLNEWKSRNGEASIKDVICCLPKKWRSNFIVVRDSESLQCSNMQSPRVVIFDPGNEEEPLKTALSFVNKNYNRHSDCNEKFSGSNAHDAIEMLEIDVNKSPAQSVTMAHIHTSGKLTHNPHTCVECHLTPQGLRPLSRDLGNPFNYINGPVHPSKDNLCKKRREKALEKDSMRSLRLIGNLGSPYTCLDIDFSKPDHIIGENLRDKNNHFTKRLALAQNFQIAKSLVDSPQYKLNKKTFLASLLGCSVDENLNKPCGKLRFQKPPKPYSTRFEDFLHPSTPASSTSLILREDLTHDTLICASGAYNCETRIPHNCTNQIREVSSLIKRAQLKQPKEYGTHLASVLHDQGRNANYSPENIQRYAQVSFLMSLGDFPNKHDYSHLFEQYPGPNSIDFDHLAKQVLSLDSEFSKLTAELGHEKKNWCTHLKPSVRQSIIEHGHFTPEGSIK